MVAATRTGAQRVAVVSLVLALLIAAVKLAVGFTSGSLGVLSEGFHSSFDAGATALTLYAVRLAVKPPDREHPYGHGRAENLAALAEASLLAVLGAGVGYAAVVRLQHHIAYSPPWYAIALIVVSMAVDFGRARTLRRAAKRYGSQALEADSLNFSADLFGSGAVLVGLIAAAAGFGIADSLAALAVVVLVWVMAGRLAISAVNVLMDRAPIGIDDQIREVAARVEGVVEVEDVKSRQSGPSTLAEITVTVGRTRSVERSHDISRKLREVISETLPGTVATVRVRPGPGGGDLEERVLAAADRIGLYEEVHNIVAISHPEGTWLSLHAQVAPHTSVGEAHEFSDQLEAELRRELPGLARVEIHLEPREVSGRHGHVLTTARDDIVSAAVETVRQHPEFVDCHEVAVTETEEGLYVVLHCGAHGRATMEDVHAASKRIEDELHRRFSEITGVTIHFEPVD